MNKKQPNFATRLAASLMTALMVFMNCVPLSVSALDIQALPDEMRSASGFTHAARVTWDDLNATDNAATIVQLFQIPTNSYIDRVAWVIEQPFTNSTIASTNLLLCIGTGGSTNFFFTTNQIDASTTMTLAGLSLQALATNSLVPLKSTTSTNYLTATFSAAASVVDNYTVGRIRIYFRVVQPSRWRF